MQALKSKYASEAETEDIEDPDVHVVFAITPEGTTTYPSPPKKGPQARSHAPIKFSGKVAEEIGFDKIRKQLAQLSELKIIILDGLCMWRPEARSLQEGGKSREEFMEGRDVKETCPKAIELDLSRNLFEEWREIAGICGQLEDLRGLRVEYDFSLQGTRVG